MRVLVDTAGDKAGLRDALAYQLMIEALADSGFHEGVIVLVNAATTLERARAVAAQAVERARLG